MNYRFWKRATDVVVSSAGLAMLSPILLTVAVLVRLNMGRPVLFRQMRPGQNGEPFELVKFRTMKSGDGTDAERLTRFGRVLRSTSLDELPELWNIARGEMSLVGPRPLLMQYLPAYSEHQARRHEVRPGLTGLAQVSGRNNLTWDERLDLDVDYVDRLSLALDLKIAGRTLAAVIRRHGITPNGADSMQPFVPLGVSTSKMQGR